MNDAQWTVGGVLQWTRAFFDRKGSESSRLDAELLMAHALGTNRTRLYMDHNKPLGPTELAAVRALVKRRGAGEPVAYIIGQKAFWTIELHVDERVLIPRPETEHLVEHALKAMESMTSPRVIDIGCGSGCIALSVASSKTCAEVWAVDISEDALAIARKNADQLGLKTVKFQHGDLLEGVEGPFDFVLSNPPYIESDAIQGLMNSVRDYEPHLALDGGVDGLDPYRRLIPQAADILRPGGHIFLEMGSTQGDDLTCLLEESGAFAEVVIYPDYAQLPRVIAARRL